MRLPCPEAGGHVPVTTVALHTRTWSRASSATVVVVPARGSHLAAWCGAVP